jgi:Ca2+-binding RTX toxin-like protein
MRGIPVRWFGLAVSLVVAAMTLTAPAVAGAAAGTVGMTGSTLVFQGGPATTNAVTIAKVTIGVNARSFFFVRDTGPGATIEVGTGCAAGEGSIACGDPAVAPGGIRSVRALLGAGNDSFLLTFQPSANTQAVGASARVTGGLGNDRITTADGADVIFGGPGLNTVRGGEGNDRLEMRNGARDVLIDCGLGIDTAVVDVKDPRPIACETVLRPRS